MVVAVDLHGSLAAPGDLSAQNLSFPNGAYVTIDNNAQRAFISNDLTFSLYDIDVGTHRLDIISQDWNYEPIRIDVDGLSQKDISFRKLFSNSKLSNLWNLSPESRMAYFYPRDSFNILSFMKSPMVILMFVALILGFLMKMMIGNMSPEELAEMKEMQSGFSVNSILKKVQEGAALPQVK